MPRNAVPGTSGGPSRRSGWTHPSAIARRWMRDSHASPTATQAPAAESAADLRQRKPRPGGRRARAAVAETGRRALGRGGLMAGLAAPQLTSCSPRPTVAGGSRAASAPPVKPRACRLRALSYLRRSRPGLRRHRVPLAARIADRGLGAARQHRLLGRVARARRCRGRAAVLRQEARHGHVRRRERAGGSPVQLALVPSVPMLSYQQLPVLRRELVPPEVDAVGLHLAARARCPSRCRSSGCRTRSRPRSWACRSALAGRTADRVGHSEQHRPAAPVVVDLVVARRCRRCRPRSGSPTPSGTPTVDFTSDSGRSR